jgi:uncharacterized BrkB/YihY/UPF0761 family membrane protein
MAVLWSLRGLSWRELAKRTLRRSWEHEIFGQAARLAFYYFLGIFPALLLLLVLLNSLSNDDSRNNLRVALLTMPTRFRPVTELPGTKLISTFTVSASLEASALRTTSRLPA